MDSELLRLIIVNAPGVGILLYILWHQQRVLDQRDQQIKQIMQECLRHLKADQDAEIERIAKMK